MRRVLCGCPSRCPPNGGWVLGPKGLSPQATQVRTVGGVEATKRVKAVAAGLAACVLLVTAASVAGAKKGSSYAEICHATGDPADPYLFMRVRWSSADGSSKKVASQKDQDRDHFLQSKALGSAAGGLWRAGAVSWGDIIPAPGKPPKSNKYGNKNVIGWNYTTAGKAILANRCEVTTTTTTTTASTTTTSTSTSTSTSSTTTSSSTTWQTVPKRTTTWNT